MKFYPNEKEGVEKVLAILKGDAKSFHSLKGGGGRFRPTIFPIL